MQKSLRAFGAFHLVEGPPHFSQDLPRAKLGLVARSRRLGGAAQTRPFFLISGQILDCCCPSIPIEAPKPT